MKAFCGSTEKMPANLRKEAKRGLERTAVFEVIYHMSLPHYRGNQKPGDMNRNPNSGAGGGARVDEVNQRLLEAQNDQRWVREHAHVQKTE